MKSIILITTLLSSITIMAKPICTFKTDSDVKIKLINKEKDSFSTAYTKFNHRLVQGQEGVETREFAIELSHHIDHYRTIFKILVDDAAAPARAPGGGGCGERSRSQLLFKLAGIATAVLAF